MLAYYKSRSEITREFGISEGAIRNWIKKSLAGEINLELKELNGKHYILRSGANKALMSQLVEEGRKFRPLEDRISVEINKNSYSHFEDKQIIDILDSLESRRVIPHKYSYINGGADYWQSFYNIAIKDAEYTTSRSDVYYFDKCYELIKDNLKHLNKINIVDIGAGNGEPATNLIKRLYSEGLLFSYNAIDISNEMLHFNRTNITKHIPEQICHFHQMDFEKSSLEDIYHSIRYSRGEKYPILALVLGAPINTTNILHTFFNISDSLQSNDILCITNSFANDETSNYKFTIDSTPTIYEMLTWVARSLGLTENLTTTEIRYNEKNGFRELNLILNKDIELVFKDLGYSIQLYKQERVNLWVHRKDTFASVSNLAEDLQMKMRLIVKHPKFEDIMYMMGKQ